MTRETLKRAIDLDQAIENAEGWMDRLREGAAIFRAQKDSGNFYLQIRTESGTQKIYDIPADVAMKAIISAHTEILEEKKRLEKMFKELS